MSEIARWSLFALLDPDFVQSIRFAVVFGAAGNEALIVTADDRVYGLGTNACSCLGIGNAQSSSLQPTPIETLSGREVISIAFGSGPHVLALTRTGDVYSWGHNAYGQLVVVSSTNAELPRCIAGSGSTNPGISPQAVTSGLGGHRILSVSCGQHHSVALTDTGEVYTWGQNSCGQLGIDSQCNQTSPKRVTALASRNVKQVTCGQNSTAVVTLTGEVFTWGYNGQGQLGLGNTQDQWVPHRVLQLNKVVISQIACGFAHTLALSDEGVLFAWGSNCCGQLGTPNINSRANQLVPIKTATELGRIMEIGAVHVCNMSAAMNIDNQIFMWGQVRGQSIAKYVPTRFTSLDDCFACFAAPPVSFRPIVFVRSESSGGIHENVRAAFDDPATADVHFRVDGKHLYAHKAILKIRCEHFRSMFNEQWKEAQADYIDISSYSFAVYRAFLYFLYTDSVHLPPEDAVALLDLANCYCEHRLKEKCVEIIRRGITVENAVLLYAAAVKYEADELKIQCFDFCLNHMTACTQSEAFSNLDESVVKQFVSEAAQNGAFKH